MSNGDSNSPTGSGGGEPHETAHQPEAKESSHRSGLYIVTSRWNEGNTELMFGDVYGHREKCRIATTPRLSRRMVIRHGLLFAADDLRHVKVHNLSTDTELRILPLYGVKDVILFGSDIYAYGSNGKLWMIDGTGEDTDLTPVARLPIDKTHRIFVVRKTNEKFEFAVQTLSQKVLIISKYESQPEMSTQIGAKNHHLVGSHDGHVFMTVTQSDESIVCNLIDFFDGRITRRWELNRPFPLSDFVWQTQYYYVDSQKDDDSDDIDHCEDCHWNVNAFDLSTGQRTTLLRTTKYIEPDFVPYLK